MSESKSFNRFVQSSARLVCCFITISYFVIIIVVALALTSVGASAQRSEPMTKEEILARCDAEGGCVYASRKAIAELIEVTKLEALKEARSRCYSLTSN
jgi:hypothetical protein